MTEEAPGPPREEMSFAAIASAILFDPAAVGASVARRSMDGRVLLAFLLLIGIMVTSGLLTFEVVSKEQLAQFRTREDLPAEAQEKAEEFLRGPLGKVMTVGSQALMPFIGISLIAFLLYLGQLAMGGTGAYGQAFSVTTFACLISFGIGTIVRTALVFAKGSFLETSTGLGILLGDRPFNDPLRAALDIFDVFPLWAAISAGLALAAPTRLSPRAALGVSLVVYFLLMLLFTSLRVLRG